MQSFDDDETQSASEESDLEENSQLLQDHQRYVTEVHNEA